MAGFYRSHPGHSAHRSATGLAEAHWLGCSYLITSVLRGRPVQTSAFHLAGTTAEDKHFEPQAIELSDAIAERLALPHNGPARKQ